MKPTLTHSDLIPIAKRFCEAFGKKHHSSLYGVTDGKAIGTFVEQEFKKYISTKFDTDIGNSANGLDLPAINTDIKVTLSKQPQSSCPYKDSKQKIYGLGYNLLLFVYEKQDFENEQTSLLKFCSCTYISAERTGDYQTTTGIHSILNNKGNSDDIFAFLCERMIPADEVTLTKLADEILHNPPPTGYLTISNALQWRLQYKRVISLQEDVEGIIPIVKKTCS
ncbi:MAG: hypothetical protein IKK73_00755 [Akkermansia sp.]|nr:hypothetical protein [Akkermansia sp.]MBR6575639.1 hypothetical protein [Akkermansia sp.]